MATHGDDETRRRGDERAGAERTLAHDAQADREYTTAERTEELERESPAGEPDPAPGEDRLRRAVERHAATGAQGADLDAARELAARDLEEEDVVGRERARDPEPTRRR